MSDIVLSDRFADAVRYASKLHAGQRRKGTQIPYVAHLLEVAGLVLEAGGDEDQAIAALLHDAAEDQGGKETLEMIRAGFGERVAKIVDGCTDAYEIPKPPWLFRKQRYLEKLLEKDADIRLVSLADKLHNARSILTELYLNGESVWERFNGGKEGTIWYHHRLKEIFQMLDGESRLFKDYARVISELESYSDSY